MELFEIETFYLNKKIRGACAQTLNIKDIPMYGYVKKEQLWNIYLCTF